MYDYRAGSWSVVVTDDAIAILDPSVDIGLARELWEVGDATSELGTWVERLASQGVSRLPSFALVEARDDGLAILTRGNITVIANDTRVTGAGLRTWREEFLPGVTQFDIVPDGSDESDQEDGADPWLPIGRGLVRASRIRARVAPGPGEPAAGEPAAVTGPALAAAVNNIDHGEPASAPVSDLAATPPADADLDDGASADLPDEPSVSAEEAAWSAGPESWLGDDVVPSDTEPEPGVPQVGEPLVEEPEGTDQLTEQPAEEAPVDPGMPGDPLAEHIPLDEPDADEELEQLQPLVQNPADQSPGDEFAPAGPADPASPAEEQSPPDLPLPPPTGAPLAENLDLGRDAGPSSPETDLGHGEPVVPSGAPPNDQWDDDATDGAGQVPGDHEGASATIVLVGNDGNQIPVDRPVLLGRSPEANRFSGSEMPRLVSVTSPERDVSGTHAEIRPASDHAVVTDLDSTNGTVVYLPDQPAFRLHPRSSVPVPPGGRIELGANVEFTVTSVEETNYS